MSRRAHTLIEFLVFDPHPRTVAAPEYQAYEVKDANSRCGFVENPSTLDLELDEQFAEAFELDLDPDDTIIDVPPPWVRPDSSSG